MRVLILSCNTGEGHNSCAKAIKEVYDRNGDTCLITDALNFISEKTSRFISWGHVFVYRNLPRLLNWGYSYSEKHAELFQEDHVMYHFFAKGADALYAFIANGAYDTAICVHPFASLMLTEAQRRYHLPVKTAFVATDYTCSPSVKDSDLNYYFVPDSLLMDEFECSNIPKSKMIPSGIPIRQMFYTHTDKAAAKKALGVRPDSKHMVITCGSMGCGPIDKLTCLLTEQLPEGFELTVICGTNEKLEEQLRQKYADRPNLHIYGYVRDMSTVLDSADLYLTKAGGISVTEAAAKKLPMIFINAVAACEDYNRAFYVQLGCAKKGADVKELLQICRLLTADEAGYQAMVDAFDTHGTQNTAECIYRTLNGDNPCTCTN